MPDTILMIGREDDNHIPFVEKHLDQPIKVIDPAKSLDGVELSYRYHDGRLHVTYDGAELKNIKSVWFRKPRPIWGDKLPVHPSHRQYSETAVLRHVRELYAVFPEAFWLSDYHAIRRADYKSLQLLTASKLGFRIPDTISTSDKTAAETFVKTHSATIVKSLASAFPNTEKDEPTMFFSKKILPGQKFDFDGLHLAPAIFQQMVDHELDIRVTVVGQTAFAASIHATGLDESLSLRDWRPAHFYGSLDIKPHELPESIERKCITLVQELGLSYGAIDLIYDKNDSYWFLECNPNGEWSFVEYATGQPIGKHVATLLQGGRAS